jgi:hypothetical protein
MSATTLPAKWESAPVTITARGRRIRNTFAAIALAVATVLSLYGAAEAGEARRCAALAETPDSYAYGYYCGPGRR